jgi:hypothetical protein
MTTYFVECFWPGVSETQLAAALDRLRNRRVRPLDTILVPADEIVLCVVEAESESAVRAAAGRAGLPSERVVECVQVVAGATSRDRTTERGQQ